MGLKAYALRPLGIGVYSDMLRVISVCGWEIEVGRVSALRQRPAKTKTLNYNDYLSKIRSESLPSVSFASPKRRTVFGLS